MYVAEMTIRSKWDVTYTINIQDDRNDIFYAKVAGAVKGATAAGNVVINLTMTDEGE